MKQRLKVPPGVQAIAHVGSRVVDKRFIFTDPEKEIFLSLFWEYAAFCGIKVISITVMDDHYHIEMDFPHQPLVLLSDEELLERVKLLTSIDPLRDRMIEKFPTWKAEKDEVHLQMFRDKFFGMMWNIGIFMRLLNQRYSRNYNDRHGREGTLFESPYNMSITEPTGPAPMIVSNYINNNPLRAGMVDDPKKYRWSTYSMALKGDERAFAGIKDVVARFLCQTVDQVPDEAVLPVYQGQLYLRAQEQRDINGQVVKKGMNPEVVVQLLDEIQNQVKNLSHKIRTSIPVLDRSQIASAQSSKNSAWPTFNRNGAFGSREFVEMLYHFNRSKFGEKRKAASYKMAGSDFYSINRQRPPKELVRQQNKK